jgi:hypothetical protein
VDSKYIQCGQSIFQLTKLYIAIIYLKGL